MGILEKLKVFELTPVEKHGEVWFKRDDKYMPFSDVPLSGGKVRQTVCLLNDNYEYIKEKCESTVITATSVNSPQGLVVARTAKEFGFKSILVMGATKEETISKNKMIQRAIKAGAETDIQSAMAYENVLMSRVNHICEYRNYFVIKFGINLDSSPGAIVDSTSYQVQNIPKDLDLLVVSIGSGITFGGILRGLVKYEIKPKKIVGVQIAGHDRNKVIRSISGDRLCEYEYIRDKTYAYSRKVKIKFNKSEFMDPVYEAKAYDWMLKNLDYRNNKTLFWIVGNSSRVRE